MGSVKTATIRKVRQPQLLWKVRKQAPVPLSFKIPAEELYAFPDLLEVVFDGSV